MTTPEGCVIDTAKVVWHGQVDLTADQLLGPAAEADSLDKAIEFLQSFLTVDRRSTEVDAELKERGISFNAYKRAKDKLGVKCQKVGLTGGWIVKALTTAEPADHAQDHARTVTVDDPLAV